MEALPSAATASSALWARLALPVKMAILTLAVGVAVLVVSDVYDTHVLEELLHARLVERLENLAKRDRVELSQFMQSYPGAMDILIGHKGLIQRVSPPPHAPTVHYRRETPPWLPHSSLLRRLPPLGFVLLLDEDGRAQETYSSRGEPIPRFLLHPSPLLLLASQNQGYMTLLEGQPFLVTSQHTEKDSPPGYLLIAVPIDAYFLDAFKPRMVRGESIMALLEGVTEPRILSSGDRTRLPPGAYLRRLQDDFLVTGLEKFDYGSSELQLYFASFIPKAEMLDLNRSLINKERRLRIFSALLLLLAFLLLGFWLARRIGLLSRRVEELSQELLGVTPPPLVSKDQLHRLEGRFQGLAEAMRQSHADLQEQARLLSEQAGRLSAIMDNVADGILIMDQESRIQSFNRAAERIFDVSADRVVGQSVTYLMPPEDRLRHTRGLSRYLAGDSSGIINRTTEVTGQRQDGSRFPMELSVTEMRLGGERLFIGILRDISARRELETVNALRETERLFRETLENIHLVALNLDMAGNITFCNDFLLRMTGWERQEVLGQNWFDLFLHEDERGRAKRFFNKTIELGERDVFPYAFVNTVRTRNGESREMAWQTTFLKDRSGNLVSKAYIGEDITERKQMELRLRQAKQEAEEASRSKTRFLANMSHEIRTPLNAIVGFTQFLLADQELLPDAHRGYLENIHTAGQNLSEMITNVLDLSKIEAGKMSASPEEVQPRLLVQGIFQINKAGAIAKKLDYNYRFDAEIPETLCADRSLLNRILMNLTGNAIKFTPAGGQVEITASRQGEWLHLSVRDQGPGIPEQDRNRIFEPFEQSAGGFRQTGTGLGLAIVKQAVDLMGGEITLDSVLGQGSTFTVKLPLVEMPGGTRQEPEALLPRAHFASGNHRVLLVEDHPLNREMLGVLLSRLGITPVMAENGEVGVEQARKEPPELILMDLEMPVMDGLAATRILRQEGFTGPIIALSADAFVEQQKRAYQAGITHYLTKPVDLNKLTPLLERYLVHGDKEAGKPSGRPPLPAEVRGKVRRGLSELAATPLYEVRKIVAVCRELTKICEPFESPYQAGLRRVVEAVYSRNARRIPDLIRELMLHG